MLILLIADDIIYFTEIIAMIVLQCKTIYSSTLLCSMTTVNDLLEIYAINLHTYNILFNYVALNYCRLFIIYILINFIILVFVHTILLKSF